MANLFDSIFEMCSNFLASIQSVLNMIGIGINAFTEHEYPNVLGSIWDVLPAGFQLFAVSFLIIGLFVALMSAILRRV